MSDLTPSTDELIDVVIQAVGAAIVSEPTDFPLQEILAVERVGDGGE